MEIVDDGEENARWHSRPEFGKTGCFFFIFPLRQLGAMHDFQPDHAAINCVTIVREAFCFFLLCYDSCDKSNKVNRLIRLL